MSPISLAIAALLLAFAPGTAAPPQAWWSAEVEQALGKAASNRAELEKALTEVPQEQRTGLAFLIVNMPDADLRTLKADFLLSNCALAYRARKQVPWGADIPEEIFLNDVLPYANVDEKRDAWRKEFHELCLPLVKGCKTPSEAAQKINSEIFKKINVRYSTQRKAPNQSPRESMDGGTASCTGLSIVLSDACRSVCVPARLVGTPLWTDKRGNHTWVEIWDGGWHFTGACEPDPKGLNRGWFVGDAARAQKDSFEHAIYAASFRKTSTHFPLVWAMRNREVPAENVTDRYATKTAPSKGLVKVSVRVLDETKNRVACPILVTASGDPAVRFEGTSRGETADANDLLTFELKPGTEYIIKAAGVQKKIKAGEAGKPQVIDLVLPTNDSNSAAALNSLRLALESPPDSLAELATRDFARVPLTKSDAARARVMLWEAHAAKIRKDRAAEIRARLLKDGKHEMPFFLKVFGPKPAGGRSLWISLHGGGNAPKEVNDRQWENQKKLYTLDEGIYVAPRAPTNTWNLWHEPHIDRLFGRLIEDLIVLEDVNPDRVYVLGYSAGGDGVYQIGPRMADRWAGAAMMAGHPNGVSLLSLRNVAFALQVGANDAAYGRNKVARDYSLELARLHEADPEGYPNFVKIHEGKGHWMGLEDKAALPWMAKYSRNPVPERVVWKQTGTPHQQSYWLAVPPGEMNGKSLVAATREGQRIHITSAEKVGELLIRLDDRMLDLDKPVVVTFAAKDLFAGVAPRTIRVMLQTLAGRGDPKLMYDAEVSVQLPAAK